MGIYMARLETGEKRHRYSITRVLLVCSFALIISSLLACNSETYITPESSIALSPPASTFEIEEVRDADGVCVYSSEFYQDVPIRLVLTDSLGRALGDAPVTVYVDYAGNTFSGPQALQLFSDTNGNGVVDTPDELVSGVGDEAFRSRTRDTVSYTHLTLPTKA